MYTVLIIPGDTMKNLKPFTPLLDAAVKGDRLGICEWNENSYSIETAVPDLYQIIENREAWRAIIVCSEKSEYDDTYKVDTINPFEYAQLPRLQDVNGGVRDVAAPLVRLTHLLMGEIPATHTPLELALDYPQIPEDSRGRSQMINDIPHFRYLKEPRQQEIIDEEKKNEYLRQRWMAVHQFTEVPPSEIILIKTRPLLTESELLRSVTSSWKVHTEFQSSEFWKRNLYPQNCRFLVFDMDCRGSMQKQKALFTLWSSVLLLTENDIDPNVLQAHRLYWMNTQLDNTQLRTVFQRTVNRLNKVHYLLDKRIRIEKENVAGNDENLPAYELTVPIDPGELDRSDLYLKTDPVGLAGGIPSGDLAFWYGYQNTAEKGLRATVKKVNRRIDKTCTQYWYQKEFFEEEVYQVNRFAEEDINRDLYWTYRDILKRQSELPRTISSMKAEINKYDNEVRNLIRERMSAGQIISLAVFILIAVLAVFIPAFILYGLRWQIAALMAVAAAVCMLTLYLTLRSQKKRLIDGMKDFELMILNAFAEIMNNTSKIGDNISDILSNIRGASFLRIMNRQKQEYESVLYSKERHMKEIEAFLDRLQNWNMSMHIGVNMQGMAADTEYLSDENTETINYDSLITLLQDKWVDIPLNETGIYVQSPYPFLRKLQIERIELYDDFDDDDEEETEIIEEAAEAEVTEE